MRKLIFPLLLFPYFLFAQNDSIEKHEISKNISLQGVYQNGYVFPTNDFLKGNNVEADTIDRFQAFSLRFSKQTIGEKQWEQLYKYPNWGISSSVFDFYNPEEIGVPFSFYGFFNAPFKRWERLSLNYELALGLTFNWKSFNPVTNKYNTSIGAGQSFIVDVGLNLRYNLSEHFDLETGFSLTHFSNGAIKLPNNGINTIAPKISLKYNFFEKLKFLKQEIPEYKDNNEWIVSLFGGVKNVIYDTLDIDIIKKYQGVYFPVVGISTSFNRQVSHKSKFGVGMSISYNSSVNAQIAIDEGDLDPVDGPFVDKLQISIYPSYELVIDKLSLIFQPSYYIYRKQTKNQSPNFYQKIGLKYHFNNDIFTGVMLRAYDFQKSDFMQWTLGYRIKWNSSKKQRSHPN